jgi:hypothetical protein
LRSAQFRGIAPNGRVVLLPRPSTSNHQGKVESGIIKHTYVHYYTPIPPKKNVGIIFTKCLTCSRHNPLENIKCRLAEFLPKKKRRKRAARKATILSRCKFSLAVGGEGGRLSFFFCFATILISFTYPRAISKWKVLIGRWSANVLADSIEDKEFFVTGRRSHGISSRQRGPKRKKKKKRQSREEMFQIRLHCFFFIFLFFFSGFKLFRPLIA